MHLLMDLCMFGYEFEGKRGSDEIASCLIKYIETIPPDVKHLIAYSDGCAGQNKNHQLQLLWMRLVVKGRFEHIEHKFLEVGHTFLPSDRCFGNIEKRKEERIMFSLRMTR